MHHKRLACALMGALAAVASAESDVTQLTKDTFDDFIKSNDLVLAECKLFCFVSAAFWSLVPCPLFPSPHQLRHRNPADMVSLQSLLPGAVTARLSRPSTRRLPRLSRRRTSSWPRSTASTRPTSARSTALRATPPSRSSAALTSSRPTPASARLTASPRTW